MKTDFWESTEIQPLPVNFITRPLAKSETREEFGLPIGSLAFSENAIKGRERLEITRATETVRAIVDIPFGTWSPTAAFSS